MEQELKAPEAPVETPKAPAEEVLIDNRRAEIEKTVTAENYPHVEPIPDVPKEVVESAKPEEPEEITKIKQSVQKRIDKVVAQKKSVEEENAELRAENERLRSSKPEILTPKDDTPPTPDQVEAYIAKMSEEGNHKEVAAATRYLIKLEKDLAIKEIEERDSKARKEADQANAKQLADWVALQKDYQTADPKDDLNLANQNGKLYKTALALYKDKELRAQGHYNDADIIMGLRRAVSDAYRELHQQGLITPKGTEVVTEKRIPRTPLAEPGAEIEEHDSQTPSRSPSDTEKVDDEITNRKKNLYRG